MSRRVPNGQATGSDPLVTRIRTLADRAGPLEPDAATRDQLMHTVFRYIQDFLTQVDDEPTYQPPGSALALADIPAQPRSATATLEVLNANVDHSGVALTSPRNFGYLPAGGLFHSALAALLGSVTNRYSGLDAVSPGAVELESATLRWLAEGIGFPREARGVFTSGASLATSTALAVARDKAGIDGVATHDREAVVYLTSQTHHCLAKALKLCGLQRVVRRQVAVDDQWRMQPDALRFAVARDLAAGRRPWLVVATAGTVNTGAVDPIDAIADVTEEYGLWLHVDGAYGGLYALCPEGRQRLQGLQRADSVVIDPHKTLFLPYGTGALLVRHGRHLAASFAMDAHYLDRTVSDGTVEPAEVPRSPADLSAELSRPFRALGLWLPLQLAGSDAFRAALSEKLHLAQLMHRMLADSARFRLGEPPQLGVIPFQVAPPGGGTAHEAERLTAKLSAEVRQRGRIFVTTTQLDGALHLRAAVGSFRTHLQDVEAAVEELVAQADRVTRDRPAAVRPAEVEASLPGLTRITRNIGPRGACMPDKLEVIVDVDGVELEETRQCELEVLGRWYGDTAEDLETAYGAYEDDTVFVALRHARHGVVGFTRLIAPGPLPQKTLTDIGEKPWSANGAEVARATGLDPHRTWDVATVGARTDLPLANGAAAGILYSAVLSVTLANGGESVVAIIDRRVRGLLKASGLILNDLPGTTAMPYMGSPACTPTYAHVAKMLLGQAERRPENFRRFWLGEGLAGDVVWRAGGRVRRGAIGRARRAITDLNGELSDRRVLVTPAGYPLGELSGGHRSGEVISLQDVEAKVD